jgi:hypothetical protein
MHIPRVLRPLALISLGFCLCSGPALVAAQSSPDQTSLDRSLVASPPQVKLLDNPFREAPIEPFKMKFEPAPQIKSGNSMFDFSSGKSYVVRGPARAADLDAQSDTACLYMRTYRVKRENPESDATTPAGYSTCQPVSRFHVRSAVDESQAAPR